MIENKTIFIAHNWSDASVNQQSKYLALQLSANNKVVFISAKKNGFHNTVINENLIVYEWPGKRPTGLKDWWFCYKLHKKYKPNIIITHFAANNIMLLVAWMLKVPYRLAYYHTTIQQYLADGGKLGVKQKIQIKLKSFFFNKATHLICPSTYSAESIIKDFKINKNKVYVVYNALPDKAFINTATNQNIGFLGRLNKSKGVDILVKAFINIAHKIPNARLIIAGKGEEEIYLNKILKQANLQNRVEWLGQVGYNNIFSFLCNINCLVVPSRIDNLPTVVLEAFSCATPVIAANTGGIPNMVEDRINGLLFQSENINHLTQCLELILTNNILRQTLSLNAKQTFNSKFLIQNYPQNLFNITGIN